MPSEYLAQLFLAVGAMTSIRLRRNRRGPAQSDGAETPAGSLAGTPLRLLQNERASPGALLLENLRTRPSSREDGS